MKYKTEAGVKFASVADIRVDLAKKEDVLLLLRSAIQNESYLCTVHTLNPEIIIQAKDYPAYGDVLNDGTLNLVDGIGLFRAIHRRNVPQFDRICGSDLIFDLATLAQSAQRPLFLLGGQTKRREKAEYFLRERFPGLTVEGYSPEFSAGLPLPDQLDIENRLNKVRPGVVAVCLGAPRQEMWIAQNRKILIGCDVRIAAGLGGTVDFLSGEVPRAPKWMRASGLEWLHRLVMEPNRLKRQLSTLPKFALHAFFDAKFVRVTDSKGPH